MTKHSRAERERRAAETIRVKEIEAAWLGSLAPDAAKAFTTAVAAARARGPVEPPPPMAPGTAAATAATRTRAEALEGRANQVLARLPRLTSHAASPTTPQGGAGEGATEHESERTLTCVSERAEGATHASGVLWRQPRRTAVPEAVTMSIEPPWPTVS